MDQTIRREAIRRTLAHRAGATPNASTVTEAALSTWQQLAARIEPVIGARGVDALFDRSLHLTSKTFPWLAVTADHGNSTASLASLWGSFETREPTVATEASVALLGTFTELLVSLIGESLTERLLGLVWMLPHTPGQEHLP